jgi:hypothetical protein
LRGQVALRPAVGEVDGILVGLREVGGRVPHREHEPALLKRSRQGRIVVRRRAGGSCDRREDADAGRRCREQSEPQPATTARLAEIAAPYRKEMPVKARPNSVSEHGTGEAPHRAAELIAVPARRGRRYVEVRTTTADSSVQTDFRSTARRV